MHGTFLFLEASLLGFVNKHLKCGLHCKVTVHQDTGHIDYIGEWQFIDFGYYEGLFSVYETIDKVPCHPRLILTTRTTLPPGTVNLNHENKQSFKDDGLCSWAADPSCMQLTHLCTGRAIYARGITLINIPSSFQAAPPKLNKVHQFFGLAGLGIVARRLRVTW